MLMRKSVAMQGKIHTVVRAGVSVFRRSTIFVLGMAAAVVLSPDTAQACSVCGGSAIGTDPGTGFNTSILFLLSMPYLVVGAIAGWLVYTHRRALRQHQRKERKEGILLGRSRRETA